MADAPKLNLADYAALLAELSLPGADLAAVLERWGVRIEEWNQLDAYWQERMSEAMDSDDDDGVPAVLSEFSEAFSAARAGSREVLPVEKYAAIHREVQRTGDVRQALKHLDVSLEDYLAAHRHYSARIAEDAELRARLQKAISTS